MAIKFPAMVGAAAKATESALAKSPELAKAQAPQEATLQSSLLMARRAQSAPLAQLAPKPWTYQEIIHANAPLIESMVAQTRKAMLANGVDPAQSSMVFGLDVIGHEVSKCLACGMIGHDYQPIVVRQLNPAIDMIDEHIAVTNEYAKRVGFKKYSIIGVDEQVLPLREFGPPANDGDAVLKRLRAFRERHDNLEKTEVVDGVTEAWMLEKLAKYNSIDASLKTTKVNKLVTNDRRFLSMGQDLLNAEPGWKGLMYVKGQASVSLRPFETQLKGAGIKSVGNAVGRSAAAVATSMFSQTIVTPEMHDLKSQLGPALLRLVQDGQGIQPVKDGFDRP
jgi:hypothetical protein